MSDLQCPARFLLLSEPDLEMAGTLRHERVAAVYDEPPGAAGTQVTASTGGGATGSAGSVGSTATGATVLGDALGLRVQVMGRRLAQVAVLSMEPDAMEDLRGLADLHRGETVVLLAEGQPGQRVDVAVDGDGVSVRQVSPGAVR